MDAGLDLVLTVIPPPADWPATKIERKAFEVASIARVLPLKALNLPEVINEQTRGKRVVPFREKVDNAEFGLLIRQYAPGLTLILNKVVPLLSPADLHAWLERHQFSYDHLVLVGGESSKIQYPGPSPLEAASLAKPFMRHLYGITIFHRQNEAERLLRKTQAGMQGFFSQIVYHLDHAWPVVERYLQLCTREGIHPARIYISLAPVSRPRDVEFLEWLGVLLDPETRAWLTEDPRDVEKRSLDRVEQLAEAIAQSGFPVGINVEHVMYNNLQVASYAVHRILQRIS